ncbi:MAG: hypothetical protein Roseis2KO_25060 [Roseivirga sp.]
MSSEKLIEELSKQDWPQIIKATTLHAVFQLKYYGLWNRRGLKGYSAQEVAMEAIEKVYAGEWKWDPEKSPLVDYLKYHVVRGLVRNLAKSGEFKSTDDKEAFEINWASIDQDAEIVENISQAQVISLLRKAISEDLEVTIILEDLLIGYKRSEICKRNNWDKRAYDNASRRLAGHISKLADKLKID